MAIVRSAIGEVDARSRGGYASICLRPVALAHLAPEAPCEKTTNWLRGVCGCSATRLSITLLGIVSSRALVSGTLIRIRQHPPLADRRLAPFQPRTLGPRRHRSD